MASKFSPNPRPNKRPPICWPPPDPPWIPPADPFQPMPVPMFAKFHVPAHGELMVTAKTFFGQADPVVANPTLWFGAWTQDGWIINLTVDTGPGPQRVELSIQGQEIGLPGAFSGTQQYPITTPWWPDGQAPFTMNLPGFLEVLAVEQLFSV